MKHRFLPFHRFLPYIFVGLVFGLFGSVVALAAVQSRCSAIMPTQFKGLQLEKMVEEATTHGLPPVVK